MKLKLNSWNGNNGRWLSALLTPMLATGWLVGWLVGCVGESKGGPVIYLNLVTACEWGRQAVWVVSGWNMLVKLGGKICSERRERGGVVVGGMVQVHKEERASRII